MIVILMLTALGSVDFGYKIATLVDNVPMLRLRVSNMILRHMQIKLADSRRVYHSKLPRRSHFCVTHSTTLRRFNDLGVEIVPGGINCIRPGQKQSILNLNKLSSNDSK